MIKYGISYYQALLGNTNVLQLPTCL